MFRPRNEQPSSLRQDRAAVVLGLTVMEAASSKEEVR
jgi:hypothetical protein